MSKTFSNSVSYLNKYITKIKSDYMSGYLKNFKATTSLEIQHHFETPKENEINKFIFMSLTD